MSSFCTALQFLFSPRTFVYFSQTLAMSQSLVAKTWLYSELKKKKRVIFRAQEKKER
jgi:hypothetical protein